MRHKKTISIISAYCKEKTLTDNLRDTAKLAIDLKDLGFSFKKVLGKYNNEYEYSFVVLVNNWDVKAYISYLSRKYNQDCWLLVEDNQAYFVDPVNDTETWQGNFKALPEWQARQQVGYTYCEILDKYFSIMAI